jgi:orotidine-5'-phosphate decarboxylase
MSDPSRVIVALDLESGDAAVDLARRVSPVFPFFKIGIRLFTQCGPALVRDIREHGHVFLDLKFHDIPSVVSDAVFQASRLGVSLLTVHASGGVEMMRNCMEKVAGLADRPRLLAVTVLTSISSLADFGVSREVPEQVQAMARLAQGAGMDGIVCSAAELALLRNNFPRPFLIVTPGIRGPEDNKGDQKRTASPADAQKAGADFLVIGRPITAARDPVDAAQRIADSLKNAL